MIIMALAAAAATASDPIVVNGHSPPEVRRQVHESIRQNRQSPQFDQIARWRSALCVKAIGIAPAVAKIVTDRIETAAREAEVAVARQPCQTNATVVFTSDGPHMAQLLAKKRGSLFAALPAQEYDRLLSAPDAIRWWYQFSLGDGQSGSSASESAAIGANASSTDGVALGGAASRSSFSSSVILTGWSVAVGSATVIVDVGRATGTPLSAVADYAARVIVAPARFPPKPSTYRSILSVFADKDAAPVALTSFDRAYMWAINRLPDERQAWTQQAMLAGLVAKRMASDEERP